MPVRLPISLPPLPRMSSRASGFFFWGMRLDPAPSREVRMCSWAYEQKKDSLQGSLGGYPRQPRPLGVKRRALPLAGWARAADPRAAPRGHAAPHLPLSTSPSTRPPAPPPTCRVRVAALHKLELAGGVDDEVLGEAGQVHQVQRGGKQILGHKVAVRHCRGGGGTAGAVCGWVGRTWAANPRFRPAPSAELHPCTPAPCTPRGW